MDYGQRIYNKAIADGMPPILATLIVGQAGHETAGFTSHVFLACNNAFGYKWIGQNTAEGACLSANDGGVYAAYSSLEDSVHEITLYIGRRQDEGVFPADLGAITTAAAYASFLKDAGYFGDTVANYANGILYWVSHIPLSAKTAAGGALLVLGALLVWVNRKRLFGGRISSIFALI